MPNTSKFERNERRNLKKYVARFVIALCSYEMNEYDEEKLYNNYYNYTKRKFDTALKTPGYIFNTNPILVISFEIWVIKK